MTGKFYDWKLFMVHWDYGNSVAIFPVSDEKINYCSASGWLMFTHLDTWSKWTKFPFHYFRTNPADSFCLTWRLQNISHANFNWKLWRELCRSEKTLKSRDDVKLSSLRAEMRENVKKNERKVFFFLNHNILSPFSCLIYFSSKTNIFSFICDGLNYFVVAYVKIFAKSLLRLRWKITSNFTRLGKLLQKLLIIFNWKLLKKKLLLMFVFAEILFFSKTFCIEINFLFNLHLRTRSV